MPPAGSAGLMSAVVVAEELELLLPLEGDEPVAVGVVEPVTDAAADCGVFEAPFEDAAVEAATP
jgi:hypothetical protein